MWSQIPAAPEERRRVPLVLPWLLAVVPLRGVLEASGFAVDGIPLRIAVVLALFALALRLWPAGLPLAATLAVLAVREVSDPAWGWRLAAVSVVPLGFWAIATGSTDPPYRWVPSGRLFRPCLVPIALAAISMLVTDDITAALRLVAAAVVLAALTVPLAGPVEVGLSAVERRAGPLTARLGWVQDRLASAGHVLGRIVGVVLTVPAAVLVLTAWAAQRLVGADPLRAPGAPGTWVRRAGADPEPQRLFTGASVLDPGGTIPALRRALAGCITALVVVGVLAVTVPLVRTAVAEVNEAAGAPVPFIDAPCSAPPDPAMEDDPGYPDTFCDTNEYAINGRFSAVTVYAMADHSSENVNVTDGVRETWRPPECSCRRVKVWMFGGSAAFGWYQRDDLTIASQLARLAWEEGIAVDVELRANPGWVLGQEQQLFAHLSVAEEEVPDIALFYDGGNELQRQRFRNESGRGADESPTSYAEDEIDRLLSEGPFPWYAGQQLSPDGAGDDELLPWDEVARHATRRYLRDLELARRSTEAAGVEGIFVWQPLLVDAGPRAGNPDALGEEDWELYTEMVDTAKAMLPDDVIDISDALDDVDRPVFKDLFHHNVDASAIIAARLLEEIRPQLRAAAGDA